MSELKSLSEIFDHRLLRIPDYQRGFAWEVHQLEDFWEDLSQLDINRVHYTGVITLEPVPQSSYQHWESDLWLIDGLGYKPSYIVDGQQRLTTAMVLIQAILESVDTNDELNYQKPDGIRQQYILQQGSDGVRRSFLFGYEKDNPSDEFLRTKIFGEYSPSSQDQLTLYTRNLEFAKNMFIEKLSELSHSEIEMLYKKLTQKFKFNLYIIDAEIDVFVTFETMNNRGKQLTSLELLKNRLIYLSTLFADHQGHKVLRKEINDSWKTIYEYLGKNPRRPLPDNQFLRNHWIMYFKYSRRKGDDYINFLLDEKFASKNVTHPDNDVKRITVEEIREYVTSLQKSVKHWFYMHNPHFALPGYTDERNKVLLDRLERLSFRHFKPLILAAFCSGQDTSDINRFLVAIERYNFLLFNLSQRRSNTGDSEFYTSARALLNSECTLESLIQKVDDWADSYYDPDRFKTYIADKYKFGKRNGFYGWDGLRYFLYEYEAFLRERGKHSHEKIDWKALNSPKKDYVTIEHIFPQTEDGEWIELFSEYTFEQKRYFTHSIGNLLPLSRAKNSSLQNDPFSLKKNNGQGVGYYNGSVCENEVALKDVWDDREIFLRGHELLKFMEERWNIELGDGDAHFKNELLHLSFVFDEENED